MVDLLLRRRIRWRVWAVGQTVFPNKANGSLVRGPDGKIVGSRLIAQPFTKDEYFQPRPSAASYDASRRRHRRSGAVELSPARSRRRHPRPDREIQQWAERPDNWSRPTSKRGSSRIRYQRKPHIVAQWADAHNGLAQAWVKADPTHAAYVDAWAKAHRAEWRIG